MADQQDNDRGRQGSITPLSVCAWIVAAVCVGVIFIDMFNEISYILHLMTIVVCTCFALLLRNVRSRRFLRPGGSVHYRQSMESNFLRTVKLTADVIRQDQGKAYSTPPESGIYEVDVRELTISDSKSNNLLHGGFSDPSVLTVQVKPDDKSNGWTIQGTRKSKGKAFYAISEGFVAPSGKAYWVETSNYQTLLVSGEYAGGQFCGDWLSSNGNRGRYTEFHRVNVLKADTAIVSTGVPLATTDDCKRDEPPLILML